MVAVEVQSLHPNRTGSEIAARPADNSYRPVVQIRSRATLSDLLEQTARVVDEHGDHSSEGCPLDEVVDRRVQAAAPRLHKVARWVRPGPFRAVAGSFDTEIAIHASHDYRNTQRCENRYPVAIFSSKSSGCVLK